jgi:hypothetical protein
MVVKHRARKQPRFPVRNMAFQSNTGMSRPTFVSVYPPAPNCVVAPSWTSNTFNVRRLKLAFRSNGNFAGSWTARFNFVCYPSTN